MLFELNLFERRSVDYLFPLKFLMNAFLREKFIQTLLRKLDIFREPSTVPDEMQGVLEKSGFLLSIGVIDCCKGTQTAS